MLLEDCGLMVNFLDPSLLPAMGMGILSGSLAHTSSFQLIFQVERVLCEQMDTFDAQKTHPFQTLVCPFRFQGSQMWLSGKQLNHYGNGLNVGMGLHLEFTYAQRDNGKEFYTLEYEKLQQDIIYHTQVYKISTHYLSICQEKGIQSMDLLSRPRQTHSCSKTMCGEK